MCSRMMFSKIVGFVETAFSPKDMKLTLVDAVTDTTKSHVVGNSKCGAVVACHRCWLLDGQVLQV